MERFKKLGIVFKTGGKMEFRCVFCGRWTRPVLVEKERVGTKCKKCDLIHFFAFDEDEKRWYYEHSERPIERGN